MRTSKLLARSAAVAVAALGIGLATAAPASAAEAGTWKAYGNTNPISSSPSTWKCASTVQIATDVGAQVCAIRSAGGGGVQGAVIVRNNRSSLFSVAALADLANTSGTVLGEWVCSSSGLGPNSWSVCFGKTIAYSGAVNSFGIANSTVLGYSAFV